ncbi:Predicted Zn-dependent protease or its inactivated homolog [Lachnospiraceae bacterium RM5]|nr:Predicted Zn-dependent protease or its inactivated homolog [Lachnospiraceae bacterium RM5]
MIDRILNIISELNISNFLLNEVKTFSNEYYFIKENLSTIRNKDISTYNLTIYADYEEDGKIFRGDASKKITPTMSDEEIKREIASTYNLAKTVKKPYFPLIKGDEMFDTSDTSSADKNVSSKDAYDNLPVSIDEIKMILFSNQTDYDFINSAEVFINRITKTIINSSGLKKSFTYYEYSGEFIIQNKDEDGDIEIFNNFSYKINPDYSSEILYKRAIDAFKESLFYTVTEGHVRGMDRKRAIPFSDDMDYENIIIEGDALYDIFKFFLEKCNTSNIYNGYSDFKLEKNLNDFYKLNEDLDLTITTNPYIPYSNEGVELRKIDIIKNNKINAFIGPCATSYYTGNTPLGEYEDFTIEPGTDIIENHTEKHLRITNFSDFQADPLSGNFGGEYRLAYYCNGKKIIPVTKGSISVDIDKILSSLVLSKTFVNKGYYIGPKYICFKA